MIPQSFINTDLVVNEDTEATKTYKLSSIKIQGYTDELGALEQAIYKEINTEMYEHPIYSFSYGIELESLIGKDAVYVKIELKRRLQECLIKNETITSIENFQYTISGDSILCAFNVISIYGELLITKEVNV